MGRCQKGEEEKSNKQKKGNGNCGPLPIGLKDLTAGAVERAKGNSQDNARIFGWSLFDQACASIW
jgi:hypothetical protein